MKTFTKQAAQGDLLITRINELPEGILQSDFKGDYVVAHSETGHHHVMNTDHAQFYTSANDEFALWVVVSEPTELKHNRSHDTHESLRVDPGVYRINRQREYTPEGFRRAAD